MSQVCVNDDGIFIQVVGMGQEYCNHIFLWPICFIMASFWTTFHTVLEGTTLGMYSQSTREPELFFLVLLLLVSFFYIRYFSEKAEKPA